MAATPAIKADMLTSQGSASRRRVLLAGALLASALLGGVLFTVLFRGPGPSEQGSSLTGKSVPLVLTADAPIETVAAEGLRSIDLSANLARVEVAPWSGDLTVRATLKGGVTASAVVRADGPYDVKLVSAAPVVPALPPAVPQPAPVDSAIAPATSASAAASAAKGPKTKKPGKDPSGSQTSKPSGQPDLKPNPFL
jgi:hypothetical protein